jgi:hypothetical protein
MSRITVAAAAATIGLFAAAPSTLAAGEHLPTNKDRNIVVNESIGGVRLGMTGAQAVKTWGSSRCAEAQDINCHYEPENTSRNYILGYTLFTLQKGKVVRVEVTSPRDISTSDHEPTFAGPLTKYKTAKGIHIGSTADKVKAAYPKAKLTYNKGGLRDYTLKTGQLRTIFRTTKFGTGYRVFTIQVEKGKITVV